MSYLRFCASVLPNKLSKLRYSSYFKHNCVVFAQIYKQTDQSRCEQSRCSIIWQMKISYANQIRDSLQRTQPKASSECVVNLELQGSVNNRLHNRLSHFCVWIHNIFDCHSSLCSHRSIILSDLRFKVKIAFRCKWKLCIKSQSR